MAGYSARALLVFIAVVSGCGRLAGVDEYEVKSAGAPATPLCPGETEVRNPEGGCEATGVARCPDAPGWAPDESGGCSYELACSKGIEATDELQLPSKCHRFGCNEPIGISWVVDSRSGGGPGHGTLDDPFITIQAAVDRASDGEAIFVGGGQYGENVVIDKAIHLVARCPTLDVIVRARDPLEPVITVRSRTEAGNGSVTIQGLRIEGGSAGVRFDGGPRSSLLDVWIERTDGPGIEIGARQEPITVSHVAIVTARGAGLAIVGSPAADVSADGLLIRDTRNDGRLGHAVYVSSGGLAPTGVFCELDSVKPPIVALSNAILEQTAGAAFFSEGADVTLTDSLLVASEEARGGSAALVARGDPSGRTRGSLFAARLVIDGPRGGGIDILDLERATIEDTVVRKVEPRPSDGCGGFGIKVESAPGRRESMGWLCPVPARRAMALSISRTLVDDAPVTGLALLEVSSSVDHLLVRRTRSDRCSGRFGDGVAAYAQRAEAEPVNIALSRIEHNARAGVAAFGANAAVTNAELTCNTGGIIGRRATVVADSSACGCGADRSMCDPVADVSLEPAIRGWE